MITLSAYHWLNDYSDYNRLIWVLLTVQAARRTYESIFVTKFGAHSRMHISHFLVGIVFYVLVSLIAFTGTSTDTSGTLAGKIRTIVETITKRAAHESNTGSAGCLLFSDYILALAFVVCNIDQYRNHVHLSGLVKYTAPSTGLFQVTSCAHYSDEIMIYGIVTAISMKLGRWSTQSLAFLAAWWFVVVNLSISAKETRAFYLTKFEDYSVKYSIVPFLY